MPALGSALLHRTRAPLTADAPLEPDYQGQPFTVWFGIKSTERPSETAQAASVLITGTCLILPNAKGTFGVGLPRLPRPSTSQKRSDAHANKQAGRSRQRVGALGARPSAPRIPRDPSCTAVHRAHPQRRQRSRPGNARDGASDQGGEAKRSRRPYPDPSRPRPARADPAAGAPVPGTSPWSRARRPPRPGRRRPGAPSSPQGAASSSGCASLSPLRSPPARHGHLGRQSAVSGRRPGCGELAVRRPRGPSARTAPASATCSAGERRGAVGGGGAARGPAHRGSCRAVCAPLGATRGSPVPPARAAQSKCRSRWIQLIKTLRVPTAPPLAPPRPPLTHGGGRGG